MGPRKYMGIMVFSWLFLDMLWCNGCWEQEKIGLLQLKQFFNDSEDSLNWNKSDDQSTSDCCKWRRVKCSLATRRVIELSLNQYRGLASLELYLNASYFLPFEELRILDLSMNKIGGYLKGEGFERLSRLSNLVFLDLSNNRFNNSLISSLGSLSSLKVLDLTGNLLSGTIDMQGLKLLLRLYGMEILKLTSNSNVLSSLIELSHLKYLDLSEIRLTRSIHVKEFEALTSLEELHMGSNHIEEFVGPKDKRTLRNLRILGLEFLQSSKSLVLQSLEAFSSLKKLYLQDNILNRTMNLLELANLSTIEELALDASALHKDFLQSIRSLTSLRILSLSGCSLGGTLPDQGWCELKNLQRLYLNANELERTLPPCLANLSSLQKLDLSNNQFTGNIASTSIGRLMSIEYLSLRYNQFQIPMSFEPFANCSNLKYFDGDENELTTYPATQGRTPKFQLQELSLSNCILYQSIAKLPDFLYYQYDLRDVVLHDNNFGGTFPSWLLENNSRMDYFSLRNNSYTGLFQLPSHPNQYLSLLDISFNGLQGQIPKNLSVVFPHLKILYAYDNAFEGNIPPRFGEMKFLGFLDMSNNHLSGQIPEQFFEPQSSLDFLLLSNNKLSRLIFPTNCNLTTISTLSLHGNNLVGRIPDLSSLKYLTWLDIKDNFISGNLPKSMANLSNLEHIDVANNNLEGLIPLELCQLHYLETLDLSENNFFGSVPSCLNQLRHLQRLRLQKNKLIELMPHAFMNNSNLIILSLGKNNFTGIIPNWIGTLSGLIVLLLQENHFNGEIPSTLCQLNGLRLLDLSSNSLSGHLPPCLGNLTRTKIEPPISVFIVSYYFFKDMVEFTSKRNSLNYTGKPLDDMFGIDLSCNHFTGKIPVEFGNLSNVRGLNLSYNNLTGSIPISFSNLKQLESLDLSYNDLNGQIPYQLTELNFLGVFNVAYNNLSGRIPNMKGQFGTFDEKSYKGNPYLCGPPLINTCDETSPASPTHDSFNGDSEDDGFMDIYDFYISFAASYVVVLLAIVIILWINPYWRQRWFYTIEVISTKCYYVFVDMFY